MSLTGHLFLGTVIVLTLAAFVALVVVWPRLARRTPRHVAGRVVLLGTVNGLVLLTAATQLNATYLFYANWADLVGSFGGHVAQKSADVGGDAHQAPELHVAGRMMPVAAHPVPPSGMGTPGTTTTYTVRGRQSGLTGTVLVQTPPDYDPSGTQVRYPVLEALDGYPGSPQQWPQVFHLPAIADQLAGSDQLRSPIVVMPEIELPAGVDTEGVNGPAGDPQVATWLTHDVPAWVGRHFPVVANRDAWATVGDSAGGYAAAMATVLDPAQFGAAIVFGGYFRPEFGQDYAPFEPTSALGRHYDLVRAVARKPPPVAIWLETSHADHVSYAGSAQFLGAIRSPTAVHADVLTDAGHRTSVWVGLEPQALRWLGQNVQGFSPSLDASTGPAAPAGPTGPAHHQRLSRSAGDRRPGASGRSGRAQRHPDGHRRTSATPSRPVRTARRA